MCTSLRSPYFRNSGSFCRPSSLNHASRHKASDKYAVGSIERPDHGPPGLVRLLDDGPVRHFDPNHVFGAGGLRDAHQIVTVLRRPVGVFNNVAVSERSAEAVPARQMIEPLVQRRISIASVQIAPRSWKRKKATAEIKPISGNRRTISMIKHRPMPNSPGWTNPCANRQCRCTFRLRRVQNSLSAALSPHYAAKDRGLADFVFGC